MRHEKNRLFNLSNSKMFVDFVLLNTVYNSTYWSESLHLSTLSGSGHIYVIIVVTSELRYGQQYEIGDLCLAGQYYILREQR